MDANDYRIFMYARQQGFDAVFTQDEDFYSLQLEHGFPPKNIWLRTGNCSTAFLAEVMISNVGLIQAFIGDEVHDCLEIYG